MVDSERVDRLLSRIADDLRRLASYRDHPAAGDIELAAAKYHFITAIEGCARVAQHLIVSEGWPVAESNADAIRTLGAEGVLDADLAEAVARAVGFRNVLVHGYADVDDQRVVGNLHRLDDLERFVAGIASWLSGQD